MPNALQSHTRKASGAVGFIKAQSTLFQTPIPVVGLQVIFVMLNKVRFPKNLFCHYIYHKSIYLNMISVILTIFSEMTNIRPTARSGSTLTTDSSITDGVSRTITSTASSTSKTTTLGSTSVTPPSTFWLIQQLRIINTNL